MANLTAKKTSFIGRYVSSVNRILVDLKELRDLRLEWDSENYSGILVDADFIGNNAHLTAANLASAVTSVQAITDLLAATGNAHNTNLFKLVP